MPRKKTAAQLDHEIAEVLADRSRRRSLTSHATKAGGSSVGRWSHRSVARSLGVPEDVVRRIYAAVKTSKQQGLYGGHSADLIERSVGRKLVGDEYTVAARAKKHLDYDPPGGYGGPRPTGTAKEPPRPQHGDPKLGEAARLVAAANTTIDGVLRRREPWGTSRNEDRDRQLLQQAADELDVAADLYEDAGANVRAGTLHERARHARRGDYKLLAAYD